MIVHLLNWGKIEFILKSISFVLSVVFFMGILAIIFKSSSKKSDKRIRKNNNFNLSQSITLKKLEKIKKRLEKGDESNLKLAIIEADEIVNNILERAGYKGKDMGERLKQISPSQIANINDLRRAHRFRNKIVHSPDVKINKEDAKRAIEIYQKIIQDLQD